MKIANWIYLGCLLYSVNKCQSCVLIINMQGNYAILMLKWLGLLDIACAVISFPVHLKCKKVEKVGILHGMKGRKPVASPDILKNAKHCNWSLTICIVNLLWSIKSRISYITSSLSGQFLAERTGRLQVFFSFLLFCFVLLLLLPPPPLKKPSAMFFGVSKGVVIINVIGWVISIAGTRKNACFAMGLKVLLV